MNADLISRFERFRTSASLDRIRMSDVPPDLKPLVKAFLGFFVPTEQQSTCFFESSGQLLAAVGEKLKSLEFGAIKQGAI